jgi:hypothetical protein
MAGVDLRINLMKEFQAITGFQENEISLFESRWRFLINQNNADLKERQLRRIIDIEEWPTISSLGNLASINIEKLLRIRDSQDCKDIRQWLQTTDGKSDAEIQQQLHSIHERLTQISSNPVSKAIRFLIPNLPFIAFPISIALSLGDQFLIEKFIGKPGPACILGNMYCSLFTNEVPGPRKRPSRKQSMRGSTNIR